MDALVLRSRLDMDVNAASVLLGYNVNIRCGIPLCRLSVCPDILGAFRNGVEIRHLF